MKKDFVIETAVDAFVALNQIPDEEAWSMLKVRDVNKKKIEEGKSFSLLNFNSAEMNEAEDFLHENKDDTELEVIDADADTVEHIKDNEDYVGQAILCCNKCKAKRFLDMDKLVPSEEDSEVYNVDTECPYCKTEGSGFELIGQVGKVAEKESEEVTLDNDTLETEDGVAFDNDYETEAPEEPEVETEEEVEEVEEVEEEEIEEPREKRRLKLALKKKEDLGDVALDDTSDLDIPELGEAFDPDQNLKEATDDVYSALVLNEEVSANAAEAWMMNKVISAMNNEEAYYGSWLYIWPDGESREECEYDFSDDESFEELKAEFVDTYKEYHEDGLYGADEETEAYAHKWDERLGLKPIDNIKRVRVEALEEDIEDEEAEEKPALKVKCFFKLVIDPEKMEQININGFEGKYEEMPEELLDLDLVSFDVVDSNLVINVEKFDADVVDENEVVFVKDLLSKLDNDKTEKITLVDSVSFEDVYSGNKEGALDKFGDYVITSIEKPEILIMTGFDEEAGDDAEAEVDAPVAESLFEQICRENNLHPYKANRYNSEEYWLNENLANEEFLQEIYTKYCEKKKVAKRFKEAFNDYIFEDVLTEKSWTMDQFNRLRELAAKLGLGETMRAIDNYAKQNELASMAEIIAHMEAEVAEKESREEAAEHMITRSDDGNCRVSVDGGKTWEECTSEEYEEFLAGGYTEVDSDLHEDVNSEETEEEVELTESINGVELSLESANTLRKFARVATDTCKAIKKYYNIDVNIAKVIADMFSDLGLLDPDFDLSALDDDVFTSMTVDTFANADSALEAIDSVLWELVGSSYAELSPEEIKQISDLLDKPEFSAENLDAAVASENFVNAVAAGEIPYMAPDAINAVEADITEAEEDLDDEYEEDEYDESVEVAVELFDKELNEYFKENYEDVVFYHTNEGSINDKGQIILKGSVMNESTEKPITWTLTPIQPLTEALETQEDVIKALGCTEFKAVNDLSEEVFKFDFKNDTNNVEIFEIKEKEKVDILNNFVKECKDCQKYMTPKEIVAQAAMWYYDNNRLACDKLGMCVCNIENQLATVIDQIDLTPLIENAEPEK